MKHMLSMHKCESHAQHVLKIIKNILSMGLDN